MSAEPVIPKCRLCRKPLAYPGALYCGAACCARWEGGERPAGQRAAPSMPGLTIDEEIAILRDKASRLVSLLTHPEPGLSTWRHFVGVALDDLALHAPHFERKKGNPDGNG